jgi:uncharacterized ferritin-like protein (DUF455 family)
VQQLVKQYRRVRPEYFHDVKENAKRLGVLYSVEVELARLVGGWIVRMPTLSEKMMLGRVCFEDAEAAEGLEVRLSELRLSASEIEQLRSRTFPTALELERTDNPHDFLAGLFRVVKPALLADIRRHLDAAPPYVDEPTVRILRQVVADVDDQIAAGLAALADRGYGGSADRGFEHRLRAGLWALDSDDGKFTADKFVGRTPVPAPRPTWPPDVELLDYQTPMPAYPTDFDGAMRRCAHDLVFSEVEALDLFGQYVYRFSQFPWEFHREAARIAWDEARHVELLLNVLERYGGRVGEFPVKAPGYEEFARTEGVMDQLIQVNVISEGELSTDTQTQHRDAFRQMGDELSALLKDYEMADEVMHGRFGIKWSHWLAEQTGEDYEAAYKRAVAAVEAFKAEYAEEGGRESPIPLVRIGLDETPDKRRVNMTAKRLAGFSQEEIDRMSASAAESFED